MVEIPGSMGRRAIQRELRRAAQEAVQRSAARLALAAFAHGMALRSLLAPARRDGDHLDRALVWGAMQPDGTVDMTELEALGVSRVLRPELIDEIRQSAARAADGLHEARP